MGNKKVTIVLAIILSVSLILSCSDDGDTTGPDDNGPDWQVQTVNVPDKMENSQDPMVQNAVTYINMANAFSNYTSFLNPPDKGGLFEDDFYAKEDSSWTYEWTSEELHITLLVELVEGVYEWVVILDGTDGEYTYNNWTFIEAESMNDNNTGHLVVYQPVTTNVLMEWEWNTNEEDVFHVINTIYGDNNTKVELISYPDGSGMVEFYTWIEGSYVIQFRAQWQADGSGTWTTYDENGNVEDTGNWS